MSERIDPATDRAAATAIRHAADRAGATAEDLQRALGALFGATVSDTSLKAERRPQGVAMSPADRHRIRVLLAEGWSRHAIARDVGCSKSTVSVIAGELRSEAR